MKFALLILLLVLTACDSQLHPLDRRTYSGSRGIDVTPQNGLIAHFTFDRTWLTESSPSIEGLNHGARFVEDRFNRPQYAVRFDGVDDFVEISGSDVMHIQPPLSYSFWVSVDQVEQTSAVFTSNYETQFNSGVFAAFDSRGSNPSISFGNGDGMGAQSRRTFHSSSRLEPGRWYHIVGVLDSVASFRLYLDGVLQDGRIDGNAEELFYGSGMGVFGRRVASLNQPPIHFSGKLDDFRFFEVALEESDVRRLFSSTD